MLLLLVRGGPQFVKFVTLRRRVLVDNGGGEILTRTQLKRTYTRTLSIVVVIVVVLVFYCSNNNFSAPPAQCNKQHTCAALKKNGTPRN